MYAGFLRATGEVAGEEMPESVGVWVGDRESAESVGEGGKSDWISAEGGA